MFNFKWKSLVHPKFNLIIFRSLRSKCQPVEIQQMDIELERVGFLYPNLNDDARTFLAQSRVNMKVKSALFELSRSYSDALQRLISPGNFIERVLPISKILLEICYMSIFHYFIPYSAFLLLLMFCCAVYMVWSFKENKEIGLVLLSSIFVTKYQVPERAFHAYLIFCLIVILTSFFFSDMFRTSIKYFVDFTGDLNFGQGLFYIIREIDYFSRCNPYTKKMTWSDSFIMTENWESLPVWVPLLDPPYYDHFEFNDSTGVCKVVFLKKEAVTEITLFRNGVLLSSYRFHNNNDYPILKKVFYNYFVNLFDSKFTFLVCNKSDSGQTDYHSFNFYDSMDYIFQNPNNLHILEVKNHLASIGEKIQFNVSRIYIDIVDELLGKGKIYKEIIYHNLSFFKNEGPNGTDGRIDLLNYVLRKRSIYVCPIKNFGNTKYRKYRSDLERIFKDYNMNYLKRTEKLNASQAYFSVKNKDNDFEIIVQDSILSVREDRKSVV